MKRLEMRNGEVVDADTERAVPYCPACEGYNVPVDGECSVCGGPIEWVGGE
jgi:hypothetical protein